MTIVCPITTATSSLAAKSLNWAALLLGGKFDANLLIVPHAHCESIPLYEAVSPLFQTTFVLPTNQLTPDNVWQDLQSYFKRRESTEPWIWWSHDWTLLRPDFKELMPHYAIKPGQAFQPKHLADFIARLPVMHTTERTHFETLQQVHAEIDFRFYLHRGCKDGSLIERMREERASPEVNVPGHVMEYYEPPLEQPPGTVDILIVTYAKDFPWLEYCLKAIDRFAVGFRQVIVAVPVNDVNELTEMVDRLGQDNVTPFPYHDAPPGKGFVMHAAKICQADLITDADFILHMDADCIMKETNYAGNYFQDGKPVMVWRPYESLKGPKLSGVVSDCHQWQLVSERTLGMPLTSYTMCRHPGIFPREIYKPFREQVERTQGEPFEQWFCKQKNDHPQGVAEFPSLGGFCYERFRDLFTWVDCMHTAPRDLMQNFWSHGGLDHYIGDGWLNGNKVDNNAQKTMTARMWIENKLAL